MVVGKGADALDNSQGRPLWVNDIWAETWMMGRREAASQVRRRDGEVFQAEKIANVNVLRQKKYG